MLLTKIIESCLAEEITKVRSTSPTATLYDLEISNISENIIKLLPEEIVKQLKKTGTISLDSIATFTLDSDPSSIKIKIDPKLEKILQDSLNQDLQRIIKLLNSDSNEENIQEGLKFLNKTTNGNLGDLFDLLDISYPFKINQFQDLLETKNLTRKLLAYLSSNLTSSNCKDYIIFDNNLCLNDLELESVPEWVADSKYNELNLSVNKIRELPKWIVKLQANKLDLSANKITDISDLKQLNCSSLDLSNNRLSSISALKSESLKWLDISRTKIECETGLESFLLELNRSCPNLTFISIHDTLMTTMWDRLFHNFAYKAADSTYFRDGDAEEGWYYDECSIGDSIQIEYHEYEEDEEYNPLGITGWSVFDDSLKFGGNELNLLILHAKDHLENIKLEITTQGESSSKYLDTFDNHELAWTSITSELYLHHNTLKVLLSRCTVVNALYQAWGGGSVNEQNKIESFFVTSDNTIEDLIRRVRREYVG